MTGLEILDSSVKIGLGAIIGGITTYITTRLNNRNEIEKGRILRCREIFEAVNDHCTRFTSALLNYWALMADWCEMANLSPKEQVDLKAKAKKAESELYDAFHELTSAEGKLLLLGMPDVRAKLRDYGVHGQKLYSEFYVGPKRLSADNIAKYREELLAKHEAFMAALSSAYLGKPGSVHNPYEAQSVKADGLTD